MNHVERSLQTFKNPHTCAQAVYAAFKDASPASLEGLKAKSGGRAEGGICGALYAAKLVVPQQYHSAMEEEFIAQTGDLECKRIKSGAKTPCVKCVEVASKLACKYGKF